MKLHVSCNACGKAFQVDQRWAGKRASCRLCGSPIRIPPPPIELGAVDGPIPGTAPEIEMLAQDLEDDVPETLYVAPTIPISDAFAARDPGGRHSHPKKKHRGPGWIAIAVSFLLGAATSASILFLVIDMRPLPVAAAAPPDVEIQIHFVDASPPDPEETRRLIIEALSSQLGEQGIHIVSEAPVKAIATIHKSREADISVAAAPGAASQPALVHEEQLDTELEFIDPVGGVFSRDHKAGGLIMEPEKLLVPEGKDLAHEVRLQQWKEAAERFATLSFPPADAIKQALRNTRRTTP